MKKIFCLLCVMLACATTPAMAGNNSFLIKQCEKIIHELDHIRIVFIEDDDFYCADLMTEANIPIQVSQALLIDEIKLHHDYTRLINSQLNEAIQSLDFSTQSYCGQKRKLRKAKDFVLRIREAVNHRTS